MLKRTQETLLNLKFLTGTNLDGRMVIRDGGKVVCRKTNLSWQGKFTNEPLTTIPPSSGTTHGSRMAPYICARAGKTMLVIGTNVASNLALVELL
jgi:hypothetical protein